MICSSSDMCCSDTSPLFTMAGKCCVGRQGLGVSADCAFLLSWKQRKGACLPVALSCPPGRTRSAAARLATWAGGPVQSLDILFFFFCCQAVQDDRLGSELWLSRVLSLPRLVRKTQFGVIQIPNLLAFLLPEIWEKEKVWVGVVSTSVF